MAQNIDNKKTTLDDDASIYKQVSDRDQKNSSVKKFKELSGEEKKQYFKDYLMKPLLIGGAVLIFLIYFIITSFKDSYTLRFQVSAYSPYYVNEKFMNDTMENFSKYWELKPNEKAYYASDLTKETIVTKITTGTLDVVIAEKAEIEKNGLLFVNLDELDDDLKAIIPEKALCKFTYTYDNKKDETVEETKTCGIYVKDTVLAKYIDPSLSEVEKNNLVIVLNAGSMSENKYTAQYKIDFIKFLFGELTFEE